MGDETPFHLASRWLRTATVALLAAACAGEPEPIEPEPEPVLAPVAPLPLPPPALPSNVRAEAGRGDWPPRSASDAVGRRTEPEHDPAGARTITFRRQPPDEAVDDEPTDGGTVEIVGTRCRARHEVPYPESEW